MWGGQYNVPLPPDGRVWDKFYEQMKVKTKKKKNQKQYKKL